LPTIKIQNAAWHGGRRSNLVTPLIGSVESVCACPTKISVLTPVTSQEIIAVAAKKAISTIPTVESIIAIKAQDRVIARIAGQIIISSGTLNGIIT
jgi:hypothetical protein